MQQNPQHGTRDALSIATYLDTFEEQLAAALGHSWLVQRVQELLWQLEQPVELWEDQVLDFLRPGRTGPAVFLPSFLSRAREQ